MEMTVKKLGLSLSPSPCLLLLYSSEGLARRRLMPLRDLRHDSVTGPLLARLRLRHRHLQSVPEVRLERLVLLAREHLRGRSLEQGLREVELLMAGSPGEDLNKLSDVELQRRKDVMELKFERNNIRKEDPDFVYDKEVSFGTAVAPAGWDEDSEEDSEEEDKEDNEDREDDRVVKSNILSVQPPFVLESEEDEDSTPRAKEPLARRFPGIQEPQEDSPSSPPEVRNSKKTLEEPELSVPEQTDEDEEFW